MTKPQAKTGHAFSLALNQSALDNVTSGTCKALSHVNVVGRAGRRRTGKTPNGKGGSKIIKE